jgi:hypothetical protein
MESVVGTVGDTDGHGGQNGGNYGGNHHNLQRNSHNNSYCTYRRRPGHQKGNCLKLKNKINCNNDTNNHSIQNQNLNGIAFTSIMMQESFATDIWILDSGVTPHVSTSGLQSGLQLHR